MEKQIQVWALKSPSAFKKACRIILFPYTQSNDNLLLFIRCSVPGVVLLVSIPDTCLLPYFLYSHEYRLTRNTVYCAMLSDQIHVVVGCPLGVPISYYYTIMVFCPYFMATILKTIKNGG